MWLKMSSFMAGSISLYLGGADHHGPALEVGCDHSRQVFRRAWEGIEPLLEQAIAHFRIAKDGVNLLVEQRHLVLRQTGRSEHRIPDIDVDIGDSLLGERWDVRSRRRAMRSTRGEHAKLAALYLRQRDVDGKEHHLHLAAQQVGHR